MSSTDDSPLRGRTTRSSAPLRRIARVWDYLLGNAAAPRRPRNRLRVEQLEGRDVPATFTFQFPDGTAGAGGFTDPAGVDTGVETQGFYLTDFTMSFGGQTFTAAQAVGGRSASGTCTASCTG